MLLMPWRGWIRALSLVALADAAGWDIEVV